MSKFHLILGNKNHSSWSLRAWLVMKATGAPFSESVIPLYRPESKAALLAQNSAGQVPILKSGATTIWDSLAIAEYLAECFPKAGLWPASPEDRATARSLAAEMHSGFPALRAEMPMNWRARIGPCALGDEVRRDIERITEVWSDAGGRDGPFLFGDFTIADAFYLPVASRFATYGVTLSERAGAYAETLLARPELAEWDRAAREEPWEITFT